MRELHRRPQPIRNLLCKLEWEEWLRQAKAYYRELGWEDRVIDGLDWGAYRDGYYADGYDPRNAVNEDLSYGDPD